jgi:hypothetical protein
MAINVKAGNRQRVLSGGWRNGLTALSRSEKERPSKLKTSGRVGSHKKYGSRSRHQSLGGMPDDTLGSGFLVPQRTLPTHLATLANDCLLVKTESRYLRGTEIKVYLFIATCLSTLRSPGGIRFPQNGCVSCSHLGLCLNNEPLVAANLKRQTGRHMEIGCRLAFNRRRRAKRRSIWPEPLLGLAQ